MRFWNLASFTGMKRRAGLSMVRSSARAACFSISFPLSDEADFEVAVEVCFPMPRRVLRKLCIDASSQTLLLVEMRKGVTI